MPDAVIADAWLTKLAGGVVLKAEMEVLEQKKNLLVEEMRNSLEGMGKNELREGLTFKMREKRLIGSKELVSQGDGVGYQGLIETEDQAKYTWVDDADSDRANKAFSQIVRLQERMKNQTTKIMRDGKEVEVPLFTDEELGDEFWEPLVREGIVPENLVPNKYSKVQEMLDATNALYLERLAEERKNGVEKGTITSKDFIKGLSKVGQDMAKAFAGADADVAVAAIQLAEFVGNTGVDVYKGIKKNNLRGTADSILAGIGAAVGSAVSSFSGSPELGKLVGGAVSSAALVGRFTERMSRQPLTEADVSEAIGFLADGFVEAGKIGSASGTRDGAQMAKVGPAAAGAFRALAKIPLLKTAVENNDPKAVIVHLLSIGKGVTDSTFATMTAITGDDHSALNRQIDQNLDLASLGVETGFLLYDAVQLDAMDEQADQILANLSKILGGALGQISPEIGKGAEAGFRVGVTPAIVAMHFKNNKPEKAIQALGLGVEKMFDLVNPNPEDPTMKKISGSVKATFEGAVKAAEIKKAFEERRFDDVSKLMSKAMTIGAKQLGAWTGVTPDGGSGDEEEGDDEESTTDALTDLGEAGSNLLALMRKPEVQQEALEKVTAAQGQQAMDEAEAEEQAFREELKQAKKDAEANYNELVQGEGGQDSAANRSIEKLIAEVVKKRMILEMAAKVSQGGMAIAAQFFKPLEIAGTAIRFITNVVTASNQAMELNKWLKVSRQSKKAASMYSPAISNFIKNREQQIAHATIKAALNLVQMAGQAVAMSGYGAAVGEAVSRCAAAAETATDLIFKAVDKAQVEVAWRLTRASLLNPTNRKLGQKVRAQSNTMAKYAIAYGALVKKDPIAIRAAASCGINELTLADKNANVHKVVKYFEIYFNQDAKVIKDKPILAEWRPKTLEVSAKCWAGAVRRGATLATVKLQENLDGALMGFLTRIEKHQETCAAAVIAKTLTLEMVSVYREDTEKAIDRLKSYVPLGEDSRPHGEMEEVRKEFMELVEVRLVDVDGLEQTALDLLNPPPPPPPKKRRRKKKKKPETPVTPPPTDGSTPPTPPPEPPKRKKKKAQTL